MYLSGNALGLGKQQVSKNLSCCLTYSFLCAASCHGDRPGKKSSQNFLLKLPKLCTIICWSPKSQPWLKVYNQLALPHVATSHYILTDTRFLNYIRVYFWLSTSFSFLFFGGEGGGGRPFNLAVLVILSPTPLSPERLYLLLRIYGKLIIPGPKQASPYPPNVFRLSWPKRTDSLQLALHMYGISLISPLLTSGLQLLRTTSGIFAVFSK